VIRLKAIMGAYHFRSMASSLERLVEPRRYNFIPPHFSMALPKREGNARMCSAETSDTFPFAIFSETSRSHLPRLCHMQAQRAVSCAFVGFEFFPSVKTAEVLRSELRKASLQISRHC
jgi:hypothetical protein